MAAFERAVQLGAPFIETDLHLTRDARFVAIHDATLDRTTNGRGVIQDFSLAELRELDAGHWFDRSFMGERIPTLDEVLAFSRQRDVIFYLEIKYDSAWGMHHALVGALQSTDSAARTVILSRDPATLRAVRMLDSAVMLGLLAEENRADLVRAAVAAGARQLCPKADLVGSKLVNEAHAADLHIATWTVNDREEMTRTIAAGVDGIMSDFPDRLRAVVEGD